MRGCALEEDDGAADDDDISSYSNLERRFCASKWRKFQEKTPPFLEMDMRDHYYISRYKKKRRERERVKEGSFVDYSI